MSDTKFVELHIIQTSTPATGSINQNITSSVKMVGPDHCFNFAYFTVNQQQFLIDIRAIATYPTKPVDCAMAMYYVDTTLSVPINTAGKYVLRFFNEGQLFKADTVQVN